MPVPTMSGPASPTLLRHLGQGNRRQSYSLVSEQAPKLCLQITGSVTLDLCGRSLSGLHIVAADPTRSKQTQCTVMNGSIWGPVRTEGLGSVRLHRLVICEGLQLRGCGKAEVISSIILPVPGLPAILCTAQPNNAEEKINAGLSMYNVYVPGVEAKSCCILEAHGLRCVRLYAIRSDHLAASMHVFGCSNVILDSCFGTLIQSDCTGHVLQNCAKSFPHSAAPHVGECDV